MIELLESVTAFELPPTLAANEMVAQRRSKGQKVLHMGFGESPFPVPKRLEQSLRENAYQKKYLPTTGEPKLQETILNYYQGKTGITKNEFDVIIAPGSKLILYALQMAIKGDLIMPVPSWVSYAPQAQMLGQKVIKLPMNRSHQGLEIDGAVFETTIVQAIKSGLNPSKLILNYPSNPTGLTFSESQLEAIAALCKKHDIFIISDEIYGFVSFDGNYRTIAKYAPERTAITGGLSKHLSLGGWRIGTGFIPKEVNGLQALLSNIASETWSCVPAPIQYASIDAYKGHQDIEDHIKACTAIHKLMNQYIAHGLKRAGIIAPIPQGAFYNYPDFAPFRDALAQLNILTSSDLAAFLFQEYGLASLAGIAFGAAPEDLTLRLSGCDYNGDAALSAYQCGATLNETFIEKHAPNIIEQIAAFSDFTKKLC